jgi:DNA-repair protein XRCC2
MDRLLHALQEYGPPTSKNRASQPIIELMSLAPGGGKTHILCHLSAIAALPRNYGGKQECTVIIDADGKFSVPRLAAQIQLLLRRNHSTDSNDE